MTDFLLDSDGDLKYPLTRGKSDEQHVGLLLEVEKGGFKENPNATVGIASFLESENPQALLAEIRKTLNADNMKVGIVKFSNGKLLIDASYTN